MYHTVTYFVNRKLLFTCPWLHNYGRMKYNYIMQLDRHYIILITDQIFLRQAWFIAGRQCCLMSAVANLMNLSLLWTVS